MSEGSHHPRVAALLDMFREGEAHLRDLPLYNPVVTIEAIGFQGVGSDAVIGVVITPWFMNLVRLPLMRKPFDGDALEQAVMVALPCGERKFAMNGDDNVGLFDALSLHSPVLAFLRPGRGPRRGRAPARHAAVAARDRGRGRCWTG